jgi:hypothetical protein
MPLSGARVHGGGQGGVRVLIVDGTVVDDYACHWQLAYSSPRSDSDLLLEGRGRLRIRLEAP